MMTSSLIIALHFISLVVLSQPSQAFVLVESSASNVVLTHCRPKTFPLHAVPLRKFSDAITFFSTPADYRCCFDSEGYFVSVNDKDAERSENRYQLGVVEEKDLPDLCKFVVASFGADAIRLSTDMSSFERMLMNPAAELLNGYSSLVAFAEVFSGTKQRVSNRIQSAHDGIVILPPYLKGLSSQEQIVKVEKDSLILILSRTTPPNAANNKRQQRIDIIASIELRLQPCDAKIPFSIPWFDRVERRLGSVIGLGMEKGSSEIQPYLSNLCVDEKFRGQQIGRALVRCVENITKTCWEYNRIYLHVDEDNTAAVNLYKSEGYRDVGHRWNPFWSGSAADIGYYVKTISVQ